MVGKRPKARPNQAKKKSTLDSRQGVGRLDDSAHGNLGAMSDGAIAPFWSALPGPLHERG